MVVALDPTGYAVRLLGDNPRLATPPAVEGGLVLRNLSSVATEVWLKSFADQDLLGSPQDVRDGRADAAIPGVSSGAHVIEVPKGDGFVRWRVQRPFTLTGRGSQAGAVPPVGTPSEATIVDSVLTSAVFAQVFEGESLAEIAEGLGGRRSAGRRAPP